jgi:hypothetical protein
MLFLSISCRENKDDYPKIILWAWERKEDLRFINNKNIEIAYLALTIRISHNALVLRRRNNILFKDERINSFPVIRIEAANNSLPYLNQSTELKIVNEITSIAIHSNAKRIQIDFDALKSQRNFYKNILKKLKNKLKDTKISITALLSWCIYDDWILDDLVDEIVPMSFDLGKEKKQILSELIKNPNLLKPYCRKSLGISTQGDFPISFKVERLYLFHPRSWTKEDLNKILRQIDLNQGIEIENE